MVLLFRQQSLMYSPTVRSDVRYQPYIQLCLLRTHRSIYSFDSSLVYTIYLNIVNIFFYLLFSWGVYYLPRDPSLWWWLAKQTWMECRLGLLQGSSVFWCLVYNPCSPFSGNCFIIHWNEVVEMTTVSCSPRCYQGDFPSCLVALDSRYKPCKRIHRRAFSEQ